VGRLAMVMTLMMIFQAFSRPSWEGSGTHLWDLWVNLARTIRRRQFGATIRRGQFCAKYISIPLPSRQYFFINPTSISAIFFINPASIRVIFFHQSRIHFNNIFHQFHFHFSNTLSSILPPFQQYFYQLRFHFSNIYLSSNILVMIWL